MSASSKITRESSNPVNKDPNTEKIKVLSAILEDDPSNANVNYELGKICRSSDKSAKALGFFKAAIKLTPTKTQYWIEYIETLISLGKIYDARSVLTQAKGKGLKSAIAEILLSKISSSALSGLNTEEVPSEAAQKIVDLYSLGKLEDALEQANRSLSNYPRSALLQNLLGVIYAKTKNIDSAIACYKKAIELQPKFMGPYFNLANILKGLVFLFERPDLHDAMITILTKNYSRPIELAKAVISALKHNSVVKTWLTRDSKPKSINSLYSLISDLSKVELLLTLMRTTPIPNLEIELAIQRLRYSILLSVNELGAEEPILKLLSALASQCFINEYIYETTDEELTAIILLDEQVNLTIRSGNTPNPVIVLCLACYQPLKEYVWSSNLRPQKALSETLLLQIKHVREERSLAKEISTLCNISNPVSKKVRDQYEENPYPRWVNVGLHPFPQTIEKVTQELKLRTTNRTTPEPVKSRILIAGCGTGAHAIETASRFTNCEILALDLSRSSLAYAIRKTRDLKISNIAFAQGDILDLNNHSEKFDIIECVGVLHHMEDPLAGWEILVQKLQSQGLMRIGLYSELARQDIVKTRKDAESMHVKTDPLSIRDFRSFLTTSDQAHHERNKQRLDFYSMSSFRDLLFHVQEHRFSIESIEESLDKLGLLFCGFEDQNIVNRFHLENIKTNDAYNLKKWRTFESNNPELFSGMYNFWCQKK